MVTEDAMRRTVAAQLRSGARALASGAAEDLLEEFPEIESRHGASAYSMWQGFLSQRVAELATSVEFDEPSLFTHEMNWLYSTLAAREIAPEDVWRSIICLSRTIEREFAEKMWAFVRPMVDHAARPENTPSEPGSLQMAQHAEAGLAEAFYKAVLSGDAGAATGLVLDAFRDGTAPEALYGRVMLPVQAEIGDLWQRDELGIADEHVATELIRASMTAVWLEATGGKASGPPVVVGSVTGDQHDTGVRAASYLMDIGGLRGICLGCDVPAEEFAVAAARFEAVAAVVSASMSVHLPHVRQTVGTIKRELPGMRVVVGGPAFHVGDEVSSRLAEKMGADAYARTPADAAALIASSR